ncbi:MAG: hypothetical protein FJ271_28800 [Planctomycetes bacterium]|nr:hypothetical protein [Planctomycetota bacterium]
MRNLLTTMIFSAGLVHFGVLTAAALVPSRLKWHEQLNKLPRLQRQMYWVYGGYVVLAIVAFGTISVFLAAELASGSPLARALCGYIAIFWGIRVALQGVFDVKPHLTAWWLTLASLIPRSYLV